MLQLLVPLLLVCTGVAAGDMFCTALGLSPMLRTRSYRGYVEVVQFLNPRYDPAMPVINTVALLSGAGAAACTSSQWGRAGFLAAAVLVAAVIAISVVKAVPINRFVLALDPLREPEDWSSRDPRTAWSRWHLLRTTLMISALALDAVAVSGLL
jgi:anthrone oxygenase-like protein